ncbi:hypothetical protein JI435_416570 [Parastagonospora nodorum SN15]|uniref:Uncharacterized protein n=1 Tax=Phaeosphaeria nodorum (strain SN15 / ATCC MYA-4574 / FGSC 10173) TaxID=321614 RepID=A0A7U2I4D6_PHANO|nr:hypothetical protein JI435_416570 [Parastagonospora nodorum SN15]
MKADTSDRNAQFGNSTATMVCRKVRCGSRDPCEIRAIRVVLS